MCIIQVFNKPVENLLDLCENWADSREKEEKSWKYRNNMKIVQIYTDGARRFARAIIENSAIGVNPMTYYL